MITHGADKPILHGRDHLPRGTDPIPFGDHTLNAIMDAGGTELTTGIKGDVQIDFRCEITSCTVLADTTGSIVIDIWKSDYAGFPPDNTDSITAAAPPTISSGVKSQDDTLTGWTTAIDAGDILRFNIDSVSVIGRADVALSLRAT